VKDKEDAVAKVMERFLLSAKGSFLDKANEMLKSWQFGTIGYTFSSWKSYVNAQKQRDLTLEARYEKVESGSGF